MLNNNFPKNLRMMPTFILLILGFLTLGIFFSYYVNRQSKILNQEIKNRNNDKIRLLDDRLIKGIVISFIVVPLLNIVSGTLIFYFTSEYSFIYAAEKMAIFNMLLNFVGMTASILIIAWAFLVRDRLHDLLDIQRGSNLWFHGFWTFFFGCLYVNYKLNQIADASNQPVMSNQNTV
jgi:hypothetical protein